MKIHLALAIVAVVFAICQTSKAQSLAQSRVSQAPPVDAYPSMPQVTGPIYAMPAQSSPAPSSVPPYTPTYEQTAPVYVIPPENTPPPTTPGENP